MYTPTVGSRKKSNDLLSLNISGSDKGNSDGISSQARKEANYQNGDIKRYDAYTAYSIFGTL